MRQDILEKISFTIKQKIVDLQDDLSKRLSQYEYDRVMPKLVDLEAGFAALKMAMINSPCDSSLITQQQFLVELSNFSTVEEQQIITIINEPHFATISGPINALLMLVQTISKMFAIFFDLDSIVRSIKIDGSVAEFKFLLPRDEFSNEILNNFKQLLHITNPEIIYDYPLGALASNSSQLYQLFILQQLLSASISMTEKKDWFELQVEISNIKAENTVIKKQHRVYLYVDGENSLRYAEMTRSVADFEITRLTSLDEVDYLLYSLKEDIAAFILIESDDTLLEFINIYKKYNFTKLPDSIIVSYIGSNHLHVPLPVGLLLNNERIITSMPTTDLQSILSEKNLTINSVFSRRIRILSLEDHPAASSVLDQLLADYCDIVHIRNPLEALQFLQQDSDFDLLLVDIGLPTMCGVEFISKLTGDAMKIPKVAVTAYTQSQISLKQQGFDQLLAKPYTSRQLFQVIQHYAIK